MSRIKRDRRGGVKTRGLFTSLVSGQIIPGRRGGWPRLVLTGPPLLVAFLVAPGLLALVGFVRALMRRRPDRMVGWVLLTVAAVLSALGWLLLASYAPAWSAVIHRQATRGDVVTVLAWWLLLGLVVGPLWWRLDQWWRERQPMGGPTERGVREETETHRRIWWTHTVQKIALEPGRPAWQARIAQVRMVADDTAGGAVIGRQLAGSWDLTDGPRGAAVIPDPPGVQHITVLGGTGSGKSELVWRIVEHELNRPEPVQVIYLNCKQDGNLALSPAMRLEQLATEHGKSVRRLVPGVMPWDPMRGTKQRVHQRLMAIEEWSEPWYQHLASVMLALALQLAQAEDRPLETLDELVKDLLQGGLHRLAQEDDRAAEALKMIEKNDGQGLVTRLMDQAIQLAGWIGGRASGGWSWEDVDVSAADLPTGTDPGTARMLLRLMLTDLQGWIAEERRPRINGRPVRLVLVVEEFSALDDDPILARRVIDMMERLRSSNGRAIVVAQSPAGLGDERAIDRIMSTSIIATGVQVTQTAVDTIVSLGGTVTNAEASVGYEAGPDRIAGSVRAQQAFAIDPNLLRGLGLGEMVIVNGRRWAHVAVTMSKAGYAAEAAHQGRLKELAAGDGVSTGQKAVEGGRVIELPADTEERASDV